MRRARIAGYPILVCLLGCIHPPVAPSPAVPAEAASTAQRTPVEPAATPPASAPPQVPLPATPPAAAAIDSPTSVPPAPVSQDATAGATGATQAAAAPGVPAKGDVPQPPVSGKPPVAKNATKTPAREAGAAAGVAAPAAVPAPRQSAPVAPSLDLKSLEQRLRDTRAIGLFTKLSLKNQVDDLLAQFRKFHGGAAQVTLPVLRQRYELLLLKVVSVLQDGDPPLAAEVSSSREAIWGILADPKKFANI